MTIDLSNSDLKSGTFFSATKYVGDISFSNITLRLSDAYVFEFKLKLTININPSFTCYAYANITNSIPETNKNCRVTNIQDIVTASTLSTPSLFGRL